MENPSEGKPNDGLIYIAKNHQPSNQAFHVGKPQKRGTGPVFLHHVPTHPPCPLAQSCRVPTCNVGRFCFDVIPA